jgi:LytS/YehU family sensor histidine kinase
LARKKSDHTPDAIMKLSKLLRFMLYDSAKPFIAVADEIRLLEDYIELEKMRFSGKLTIDFLKDIADEEGSIAPLLLLPFVENAFKHGASESRFASFIHLELQLKDGILKFSVKNTKEDNDQKGNSETIGLHNVKRQLELLYTEYDIEVINESSLFIVLLTINLKSYAKNKIAYS